MLRVHPWGQAALSPQQHCEARQCSLTLRFLPSCLQLGDPTLNALEIWGAEYQESNALLLRPSDRDFLSRASARERCPVCFVGTITGDKRVSCHQRSRVAAIGRLAWVRGLGGEMLKEQNENQ